MSTALERKPKLVHVTEGKVSCDEAWERAFQRFETAQQEIQKFIKRLRGFGCDQWDRELSIVEIFCGRGNALVAWERLRFCNLEGADLSANLISQYNGPAKCFVADCRELPFDDRSRDVVMVQGGLHHLPNFPSDVEQTVAEVRRVLKPNGRFVVVEPWNTPFLRMVHAASASAIGKRLWSKLGAFEEMYQHERETYDRWRRNPRVILDILNRSFVSESCRRGWGKLRFLGRPR
jgi:ubiquinone/menaquinone biosynthesis C-methylase UbiE